MAGTDSSNRLQEVETGTGNGIFVVIGRRQFSGKTGGQARIGTGWT
jgi:hypothetical protein